MRFTAWNPFAEMNDLLNRMMGPGGVPGPLLEGGAGLELLPAADVGETVTEYLVRVELPGVAKEDVKVTVKDGALSVEGERKGVLEEIREKLHLAEGCYGKFNRTFGLPDNFVADAVRCEYKDGLLTVHIPKGAREVPREITVH
jgi:HSP20 family protein